MDYQEFLKKKSQLGEGSGFCPNWIPDFLFPFQQSLVEWATWRGRAAVLADCGLGKTPMQLVWSKNIVRHTNKNVLIITPLAVSDQTVKEGEKFGIGAKRSKDGKLPGSKIVVTNYESLHHFSASDFVGAVCDESSCLKNFDGKRKKLITEFLRLMPYRLLCTATASPNDYTEMGTSSEALGELGYMDMLTRFFRADTTIPARIGLRIGDFRSQIGPRTKFRFKRHGEQEFWRWVARWARACRRPSDLGFSDDAFVLPELIERETVVKSAKPRDGFLFELPAIGLHEQREELRATIKERCEMAARLVNHKEPAVVWCHLNAEGDLLESIIPFSRQISGSQSDDEKEELFAAFISGHLRVLITKPKIGAWGLNLQQCSRMVMFPSHSFEQYYQSVRRCWRFGQKNPVTVDIITTEGQRNVLENLQRKARAADVMFSELVKYMSDSLKVNRSFQSEQIWEVPKWL